MGRRSVASVCVLAAGCAGEQSALSPAGPIASEIAWLWWGMLAMAAAIAALVFALLLYAALVRPERRREIRPLRLVYAGGIALPVVVLSVLMLLGIRAGSGATAEAPAAAIRIRVTGHQFWWDVEYDFGAPATRFTTANELYVPTGAPVKLLLTSRDVIHSLWVPSLAGKIDLIPGRVNRLMIEADTEGIFRGQCAEFCGIAHSQMAFHIVAVSPEAFDEWAERQLAPAVTPDDVQLERGRVLFHAAGCALCHTVRGAKAWGRAGPDLTHFGSRRALGAGVLANTRENVAWWIAHNDAVKPRNRMPEYDDLPLEIRSTIAAYLEALE